MSTLNAEIQDAITSSDKDRARTLLSQALKTADAETYYLASLVAIDDNQKRGFLHKALELDPFYKKAYLELQNSSTPLSESISSEALPVSAVVNTFEDTSATTKIQVSEMSIGNALILTLIGFAFAGIIVQLDSIIGTPFVTGSLNTELDWLSYPFAGFVAGITFATVLSLMQPFFKAKSSQIAIGWTTGWFLTKVLSNSLVTPEFAGFWRRVVVEMPEMLMVAFTASMVIAQFKARVRAKVFFYWLAAYSVSWIFGELWPTINRTVYPSDVPFLVSTSVLFNCIIGVIGSYLTLKELST